MDDKNQNHRIKKMVQLPGKKALFFVIEDSANPDYIELNGVKMRKAQFEHEHQGYKIISMVRLS